MPKRMTDWLTKPRKSLLKLDAWNIGKEIKYWQFQKRAAIKEGKMRWKSDASKMIKSKEAELKKIQRLLGKI